MGKNLVKQQRDSLVKLWDALPKHYEVFDGVCIAYVVLPRATWMQLDRNRGQHYPRIGRALLARRGSSYEVAIFAAKADPYIRYTVYHEHVEAQTLIAKKSSQEILTMALGYVDHSKLPQETLATLKKVVKLRGAHAAAIIREVLLAKEEMAPAAFNTFLQDVLERA